MPNAAGRLVASTAEPSFSGLYINDPLDDQEDRQHLHNFTATVVLTKKHIAANSHDNYQGAAAGKYVRICSNDDIQVSHVCSFTLLFQASRCRCLW